MMSCERVYLSAIQVQIGNYTDVVDLKLKIDSLPAPNGGTNIHEALTTMRSVFTSDHRFDDKPFKRLIGIVITDGEDGQTELVKSEASAAHADGIVVISIGKTMSGNVSRLLTLSTTNQSHQLLTPLPIRDFTISDYFQLVAVPNYFITNFSQTYRL